MGAVGSLRRVKSAARVAHAVMKYTKHSFLVGEAGSFIYFTLIGVFGSSIGFQHIEVQQRGRKEGCWRREGRDGEVKQ